MICLFFRFGQILKFLHLLIARSPKNPMETLATPDGRRQFQGDTLHESTTTWLRTLLTATASSASVVVSSWLVSGLGLETLRQQVQGRWSEARLQACLPRLRRFLCSRRRRRGHQESTVRTWLAHRACACPDRQQKAA